MLHLSDQNAERRKWLCSMGIEEAPTSGGCGGYEFWKERDRELEEMPGARHAVLKPQCAATRNITRGLLLRISGARAAHQLPGEGVFRQGVSDVKWRWRRQPRSPEGA